MKNKECRNLIGKSISGDRSIALFSRTMESGIYYFGRNAAMMALVGQQLKAAGMEAEGSMDEQELMEKLQAGSAKLLVIGGGVEDGPRARLKELCTQKGVLVLEHFAGPGSLPANIAEALG